MLLSQVDYVIFLFMGVILLIVGLTILFTIGMVFTPWLQAFMAGAPVSVLQIVGMRLRKVDVRVVIRSLIMATQAGVPVDSREMESAYLQGVDLEKITLAMIHAKREGMEVTFQDLVQADLDDRLHVKLGVRK